MSVLASRGIAWIMPLVAVPASRALDASEGRSDLLRLVGLEKLGVHQTADDVNTGKHDAIAVVLLW